MLLYYMKQGGYYIMKMEEHVNYPIKYAVMPIVEQVGWSIGLNQLERDYDVVTYIVSKCYVVGEQKLNFSDGTSKMSYEVVFPYQNEYMDRQLPEFNIFSQKCTNSTFVNQCFDSFDVALEVANKLNNDILHHEIGCLSFDNNFDTSLEILKRKHQERLDKYKRLESEIQRYTASMEITQNRSSILEDIMKRILERPDVFYTRLADVLSIQEREYLKQLSENRKCENCEKNVFKEDGNSLGSRCWNIPSLSRKYNQ